MKHWHSCARYWKLKMACPFNKEPAHEESMEDEGRAEKEMVLAIDQTVAEGIPITFSIRFSILAVLETALDEMLRPPNQTITTPWQPPPIEGEGDPWREIRTIPDVEKIKETTERIRIAVEPETPGDAIGRPVGGYSSAEAFTPAVGTGPSAVRGVGGFSSADRYLDFAQAAFIGLVTTLTHYNYTGARGRHDSANRPGSLRQAERGTITHIRQQSQRTLPKSIPKAAMSVPRLQTGFGGPAGGGAGATRGGGGGGEIFKSPVYGPRPGYEGFRQAISESSPEPGNW